MRLKHGCIVKINEVCYKFNSQWGQGAHKVYHLENIETKESITVLDLDKQVQSGQAQIVEKKKINLSILEDGIEGE